MSHNVPASIHQRLLNHAKTNGLRFNDVLQRYALERWLFRLSVSPCADRFVLKGALMLTVWNLPLTRPTRDIDMLAMTPNDLEAVKRVVADISRAEVEDDGLAFDAETITTERIAEDARYEGVRVAFRAQLGNARVAMQVDLGFSDVVTPGPVEITYPTLLDQPAPRLKAYNAETAMAEKFEAMVKLGELNSRMKDFFDLWTLARSGAFDRQTLQAAIEKTFARRQTQAKPSAACFLESYGTSVDKQAQWSAFVRRSQLTDHVPESFEDVWRAVVVLLKSTLMLSEK